MQSSAAPESSARQAGMPGAAAVPAPRTERTEREVLAAAFYLARLTPDWPTRPFWMLRRCVVPYVSAGQCLLLRREGVPVAFAGWAWEPEGAHGVGTAPWREYRYLPSMMELSQACGAAGAKVIITELISPFAPPSRMAAEVSRRLAGQTGGAVQWMEYDAERKIAAVHDLGHADDPKDAGAMP